MNFKEFVDDVKIREGTVSPFPLSNGLCDDIEHQLYMDFLYLNRMEDIANAIYELSSMVERLSDSYER